MIATWLAGKVSGLIIFGLAVLGVLLIPAMVVQTVRINGISVLGWYAVDGYKPLYEQAVRDSTTMRTKLANISRGLDVCNASVTGLGKLGVTLTAQAQRLIDIAKTMDGDLQSNRVAIGKIQSTGETCPTASAIIARAFQ